MVLARTERWQAMNALVLLAEVQSGGQIEKITQAFGADSSHLIAQIISFSIVCALLYQFAYRPIRRILEERRVQIRQVLANTEQIKAGLARSEAQGWEVIGNANAAANKIIEEARAAAAKGREREIEKVIAVAEQIIANAREAVAEDYDHMLAELKCELGRLVVQPAPTVTDKILTDEDERRLIEETAKQIPV